MPDAPSFDPNRDSVVVMNQTEIATAEIERALRDENQPLMAAMINWARTNQPRRRGGMIERDRFLTPHRAFDVIRTCRDAMSDDVIEGAADVTEALTFSESSFFAEDADEQDVWNQWAGKVDLDSRLREAWRTLYTDSHVVFGMLWGKQSFKVRGVTEAGRARRRQFVDLDMPTALTIIDTLKVAPVGTMLFGRERLAYVAEQVEADEFDRAIARRGKQGQITDLLGGYDREELAPMSDDIIEQLIEKRYEPDDYERIELSKAGINTTNLYLMRRDSVFRHTLTKAGYRRFADVRLRSVLEWLDIKHQQKAMDRTFLLAGTNFIVIVKKGSKDEPAYPEELASLTASVSSISQHPVIVSDHRLTIEIVTPKLDSTLDRNRYDTIDSRIAARAYGTFVPTTDESDPLKTGRVIAEGLQSRRLMIRRSFEANIIKLVLDRNKDAFTAKPQLKFYPQQISLTFDAAWATFLLDLRASNELSRDTLLRQFGMDQHDEALLRKREADSGLDDTFQTQAPPGAPAAKPVPGQPALPPAASPRPPAAAPIADPAGNAAKRSAGRRGGGTRNGGGSAPGSGQGEAPRKGVPKDKGRKAAAADDVEGVDVSEETE